VDAAVAVGYALAVTHPSAGNIGGGGFLLVRMSGQNTVAIDFREAAPAALTREKFDAMIASGAIGGAAVGVPGTVAGLNLAHAQFGQLAPAEVLAPALQLARGGHRIGAREAQSINWNWCYLRRDPTARALFGQAGKPKKMGTKLVRRELAVTLERIARHGNAGFYKGPTARALVDGLGPGGMMTLADLAEYRAVRREPLALGYRGLQVEVMPPPSAGGVALALMLQTLELLKAHELKAGSTAALHLFLEASRRAQLVRQFAVSDPDALSAEEVASRSRRWTDPATLLALGPAIDPERATRSSELHPLHSAGPEPEHTTHFAVVDRNGNVASCTTTLSAGFGARLVAPGTGVVLNNSVAAFATAGANLPEPGRRSVSSMAPTLVLRQGKPVLVLGSPGGDTIPSTIVQVLRNVVDRGMTIDQAVDAPRVHHDFRPDELRYERRRPLPAPVLSALVKLGHRVSSKRIPIGDANSILVDDGVAWAYADTREGGLALAAKPPP
jgi:gamma-glutamyltranspeptidase/glutathione hydrolase